MTPLRILTAVSLAVGAIITAVVFHFMGPSTSESRPCHDASYHVTPPIEQYYDRLRVEHIPAPPNYRRGAAGQGRYCLNLAAWYVGIQRALSSGISRKDIQDWHLERLDYEIAHDWLTREDSDALLKYAATAPLFVEDMAILGMVKSDECYRKRNRPPVEPDSSV